MFNLFINHSFNHSVKRINVTEVYNIIKTGKVSFSKEELNRVKEVSTPTTYNTWLDSLGTIYKEVQTDDYGLHLTLNNTDKNSLPTVIFNTTHDSGCKLKDAGEWTEPTKKLIIDLDIKNIPVESLKGRHTHESLSYAIWENINVASKDISGLLMGWISPSGKGIKLLYNIDATSVYDFLPAQKRIIEDLNKLLKFDLNQFPGVVDTSSNSAKQQCYIGYTENLFFTDSVQYLTLAPTKKKSATTIKDPNKKLAQLEATTLNNYSPLDSVYKSGFDNAIVKHIYSLAAIGFTEDYIEKACKKWLTYPDNTNHNGRIVYKEKIPAKIKEIVKGIIPANGGKFSITNDASSDEQLIFENWWAIDSNNKVHIDQSKLEVAFREFGFTYIQEDINKKLYVNRDNIVTLVGFKNEDITSYLHKHFFDIYLKEANGNYRHKANEIITKTKDLYFGKKDRFYINTISLNDFDKDTRGTTKLYLSNGVVCITEDSITLKAYKDLDKPVFETSITKEWNSNYGTTQAEFIPTYWQQHKMIQVFKNIAGNTPEKFDYLCSALGYLVNCHKNRGNNKSIMLMDGFKENQDEIGGTGKSLLGVFIKNLRNTTTIHTAKDNRFKNQSLTLSTQITYLEDLKFTDTSITDLRDYNDCYVTIEEKGKSPVVLENYNTPRLLITTNYVPDSDASADIRRHYLFCVADYYSKDYTVKDEIGFELFNDFKREDWYTWLNFAAHCCQMYLKNGVMYVDETHKLISKRNAQSLNNIDNEDLVDFIIDRCDEVRSLNADYLFKLSTLKEKFPKNKMGAKKLNSFIEEIVTKQGLVFRKGVRDTSGNNRCNAISTTLEQAMNYNQVATKL